METLDEYNNRRNEEIRRSKAIDRNNVLAGVLCHCGKEMVYTNPGYFLSSIPPQKNVHCESCGKTGFKVC